VREGREGGQGGEEDGRERVREEGRAECEGCEGSGAGKRYTDT
jgi:hypothetical protein